MKKNLIKLATLTTVFALGVGLAINTQKQPIAASAAQHTANYADFTYSGSYYNSLDTSGTDGLTGTFYSALSAYIYPKAWYTYSGGSGNANYLSGALQEADEDPTNSNNMVYLYTRDSVAKNPATTWNREHVWPQSLSGTNPTTHNDNWGTSEAGTDILHLRPTYEVTNRERGNKKYGYISGTKTAEIYNGMEYGYISGNYFEPLDAAKGDVARIIMYIYVAYNAHYGNSLNILDTFASYDTLIKWHTADKPDALEGVRNDFSETSKQKNRNPFVDHPEYAWRIFGEKVSASIKNACIEKYPAQGGSSSSAPSSSYYSSVSSQSISVNPVGNGFNVVFKTNSDDGTGDLTTTTVMNQMSSNSLVSGVESVTKIFAGKDGLKLGSSKAAGSIKFTLVEAARNKINNITVISAPYGNGSDGGKLSVQLDSNVISSDITPGTDFTKNLDNINATSLTISTTTKRAYICSITLTIYQEQQGGGSSSSQPSSSSSSAEYSCIDYTSSVPGSSEIPSSQSASIEEPSIAPSSETPSSQEITSEKPAETSTQAPVQSEEPATSSNEEKTTRGCGGSVVGTVSLVALSGLIGLVFVFSKKKQ